MKRCTMACFSFCYLFCFDFHSWIISISQFESDFSKWGHSRGETNLSAICHEDRLCSSRRQSGPGQRLQAAELLSRRRNTGELQQVNLFILRIITHHTIGSKGLSLLLGMFFILFLMKNENKEDKIILSSKIRSLCAKLNKTRKCLLLTENHWGAST